MSPPAPLHNKNASMLRKPLLHYTGHELLLWWTRRAPYSSSSLSWSVGRQRRQTARVSVGCCSPVCPVQSSRPHPVQWCCVPVSPGWKLYQSGEIYKLSRERVAREIRRRDHHPEIIIIIHQKRSIATQSTLFLSRGPVPNIVISSRIKPVSISFAD